MVWHRCKTLLRFRLRHVFKVLTFFLFLQLFYFLNVGKIALFGRSFVRFTLYYRTVVCPVLCLSVTLVYCDQTVERIKMKLGTQVGLSPGYTVLVPPKKEEKAHTPIFGPCPLWPNG